MSKSVVAGLVTLISLFTFSTVYAVPVHEWSGCFGGAANNTGFDVAVDGSGNLVVVGTFLGSMTVGGQVLTSAGASDVFLAKFSANGVYLWSQRFGGTGNDVGKGVIVDASGNIVMTGHFRGPVSFGGDPLTGPGLQDIVVAKYDGAGVHQWSQWYGSSGGDEGQDVAVDALGNVIVTGLYGGVIHFGGGVDTPAFGGSDMFVLKLNAVGSYQWSKGIGGPNADAGNAVAVDASNNVVLTGMFNNMVDFGGGPLTNAGSNDAFVVKYAENGDHQWSTRIGGGGVDTGQGIAADASGVFVTGTNNGAFLVKYATNGVLEWSRSFRSNIGVQGQDVAIGPAGTIAFTGNLRGTTNFGGVPLTSVGDDDIFLALFDATGTHRWSERYGNTGDDWGHGCAYDASGDLMVTGVFSSSVDLGGGPLISAGLNDVFMVKFDDDVVDTTPPVIACPANVEVEQTTPAGTPATHPVIAAFLAGASATDDTDPAPTITHDAPDFFPVGATVVTFRATDVAGNHAECTAEVSVLGAAPPRITIVLDKDLLWPPNHQFVTVCAKVTVSGSGMWESNYWLVSITCNEPVKRGGSRARPDIRGAEFGTPDLCFDLRAERTGSRGDRIYEIVYAASNGSGSPVYATAFVRVPHDMCPELTSVHPNPFNPQATMEYTLWEDGYVQMSIYDVRGSLVRRLVDQAMPAGEHRVVWTGLDQADRPVGSGIYFVKITSSSQSDTRKIVLLK